MKIIKKNKIFLMFIIIGLIMGSIGTVFGKTLIEAKKIYYSEDKSIQTSLEELYEKKDQIGKCPSGNYCVLDYGPEASGATIDTTNIPSDAKGLMGIAYLNPTNLSASCTSSSITTAGTYSGCMKWYIFDTQQISGKTYYTMILDHNIVYVVNYNSTRNNTYQKEIFAQLNNLVNSYNWKVSPRLMRYDEVIKITNSNFYFDAVNCPDGSCSTGKNNYYWLFDYTSGCTSHGCKVANGSTAGYWLSYESFTSTETMQTVCFLGRFSPQYTDSSSNYGLRPVITVTK